MLEDNEKKTQIRSIVSIISNPKIVQKSTQKTPQLKINKLPLSLGTNEKKKNRYIQLYQ